MGGGGAPLWMVREKVEGFVPPPHWREEDSVFIVAG
jgi:hypothetical protein